MSQGGTVRDVFQDPLQIEGLVVLGREDRPIERCQLSLKWRATPYIPSRSRPGCTDPLNTTAPAHHRQIETFSNIYKHSTRGVAFGGRLDDLWMGLLEPAKLDT